MHPEWGSCAVLPRFGAGRQAFASARACAMDPAVARVLGDLLRTAAREAPDAEAFRYRGERLGAITTGINVRYRRTEIGHILGRSGAALLLAVDCWHDADFRAAVEGLRPGLPELREVAWFPAARLAASTAGA